MDHLIGLPGGKMYLKIFETSPTGTNFKYLPYMTVNSKGHIGACQAESFCESVFSIAKGVINEGNVGLNDDCMNTVTTLTFMRENHRAEDMAAATTGEPEQKEQEKVVIEDDFDDYCNSF